MVEKWTQDATGNDGGSAPFSIEASGAPMEYERAVNEFEGDEALLMEVAEGFIQNVRSQIETIRRALAEGDAKTARKEAHAIKGGAANLTADALSAVAFELENLGISGAVEHGADILKTLESEFRRFEDFCAEIFHSF